ncbi:hypothetical protein ACLE20_13815 [Rhizobium sp. YIM 134829]|uniref:hypothetical protein n=1 Tax=Rhizobium sp. YIM 134829 TaxID=3390453 RepID=UPI00397BA9FA
MLDRPDVETDMPMSFSLFTFDFFGAWRRARHETLQDTAAVKTEWADTRQDPSGDGQRAVDEAKFWGIESVPVA